MTNAAITSRSRMWIPGTLMRVRFDDRLGFGDDVTSGFSVKIVQRSMTRVFFDPEGWFKKK